MKLRDRNNSGFTLVEILVALAIIAIALGALIKASANHTESATYLKNKTLAHFVAMNEITSLRVKKQWPDLGKKDGSQEMAGREWFWTRDTVKTQDDTVRQVNITVYLDDDRKNNLDHMVAYVSLPKNTSAPTGQTGIPAGGGSGVGSQ